jgi:Ser/Thr protein kinase RdoA (MazF antagonist)
VARNGRRAFVKAAGLDLNPDTPGIHRREIAVTAALPRNAPAPRLLGSFDDGDWVALVLEDVDGRAPRTPWEDDELARVVDALTDLSRVLTPAPDIDVPSIEDDLRTEFTAWDRLAADPPPDLDPWVRSRLGALAALGRGSLDAVSGTTLLHGDLRADNLLLTPDRVVVVDWPWACRGAAWVDLVLFAINPALYGGHDPDAILARAGVLDGVDQDAVTAVVAGAAGYFTEACRKPTVDRMPTVRSFQCAQGDVCLDWLRRRGL